jgi:hypothetical protein
LVTIGRPLSAANKLVALKMEGTLSTKVMSKSSKAAFTLAGEAEGMAILLYGAALIA